jgi:hypothetical protein
MGSHYDGVAIAHENCGIARISQLRCRFDQAIEHNLEIEGRATDDLEHVSRGSLLVSRLRQLAGKSADLLLQIGKG